MPADYKGYSTRKKNKGQHNGKKRHWLWLGITAGLIILLIIIYSINKNQRFKKPVKEILHKSAIAAKKVKKEVVKKLKQPEVKFEFYNLLPKEKVTIPGNNKPNQPIDKQKPIDHSHYLLQVASLKNFSDADTMKAQLIMKGFAAQVKKIIVKGNTWFRVQVGPFNSMDAALTAQNKLRKDNHDALIRKIKPKN